MSNSQPFSDEIKHRLDALITEKLAKKKTVSALLLDAILYMMKNGGKRIRPILIYSIGKALEIDLKSLDSSALAMELIHTYSLIHDDLPSMDNADLRRGKPSCHIQFDEATAILAGDAMQALAYEIIAEDQLLQPEQKIKIILALAHASSLEGIAAGQILDLNLQENASLDDIEHLHHYKTGSLLLACTQMALAVSPTTDAQTKTQLEEYTRQIGLAFQIQDDILDIEAEESMLGKPKGIDAINNKKTYPSFIGLEGAKQSVQTLLTNARELIAPLPLQAKYLIDFISILMDRRF